MSDIPPRQLQLDLACAIARIVQCYEQGFWTENRDQFRGTAVVWARLRTCDVPRLLRWVTEEHMRELLFEEWPELKSG